MKAKEAKIVIPEPFFNIVVGGSNRAFYNVKNLLWELCVRANEGKDEDVVYELNEAYSTDKCDYEGDLESITIENCEKTEDWIKLILDEYEITDKVPEGMSVIVSIFQQY